MATFQTKSVLITGCSTGGIGWALAKAFQKRNFQVFATARDVSKAADLSDLSNLEVLELDVTSSLSISQCKEVVERRTGGRLDILINNAGVEFQSPLLDVDIDKARNLYEVNVWGVLAMVQAFVPLLIEAKGTVINQSSIDGVLNMAWAGVYASSKAAMARISETLRVELAPLNVRVVTVMCGSVDTPMFGKPGGRMSLSESSHYYHVQNTARKERMDHQKKAMNVDLLAEKLVGDVLAGATGAIWRGALATIVRMLTTFLPSAYVDSLVNKERGVNMVRH